MAAGVFRHLAQRGVAHAAEGEAVAHVECAIDVVEAVEDGVGALGGVDGVFDLVMATLIFAVGDQYENFAADLSFGRLPAELRRSPRPIRIRD